MSIHKLHIFAKNRDAIASQKGYSFQQLKTIEDWIENRIANGDDEIYCDYEDDILSRDTLKGKTTFKQIKLYSTDFSFSSDAIRKAIAHFFTLYTKGEYSFDDVEFHFETNASIIGRTVQDNDAALLVDWYQNQKKLSDTLLLRIRIRIKKIIGEYVEERTKELEKSIDIKSDVQSAKITYDNLSDEHFDAFIKCISWQFDGENVNQAIENILLRIENLIPKIPLPLNFKRINVYSSLLINEVFHKSIQDSPEERKLTKNLIDTVLLNAGEEEDKWYAETVQQFTNTSISHFYQGEFQTAINAANYCRWKELDNSHKSVWLTILLEYYRLPETPVANKRKALYEYLFLKIGHDLLQDRTVSPIAHDVELIHYYFDNWNSTGRVQDMEDDIVLLQLVKSQIKGFGFAFTWDLVFKWETNIETYLKSEVVKEKNIDRLCELLEMQGHLASQADIEDPISGYEKAFAYYRKIPPLLEHAHFYSLSRLYKQLQQMITMLTKYGIDKLVASIDKFREEIQPYAERTGLRHTRAHNYIERGAIHAQRHDLKNYLEALKLFHKAKSLWKLEFTKEGYVLALLGIADVYEGLGMTYAAKYYSLIAFWSTWHFADSKLYKYILKAFSRIFRCDYRHGAWMHAIEDVQQYLISKREFDEKGFEIHEDDIYHRVIAEIATVFHAIPFIHPDLNDYIKLLKTKLGFVWTQQINPLIEEISKRISDVEKLKPILARNFIDIPLNDVGPIRNIRFNALDNEWHIQFENNQVMTVIGEEFVSFFQVLLAEISRTNPNVLSTGNQIHLQIQKGHFQKELIGKNNWVLSIPELDSKEQSEVQWQYLYIGILATNILGELSTDSKQAFKEFYFEVLLKDESLGEKVFEASSYQRVFRNILCAPIEGFKQKSEFAELDPDMIGINYPNWLSMK